MRGGDKRFRSAAEIMEIGLRRRAMTLDEGSTFQRNLSAAKEEA
jgi:hypothetical protein